MRIIDTLREKQIGLGNWEFNNKILKGHCILNKELAQNLQINKGDIIYLSFSHPIMIYKLAERLKYSDPNK